MTVPTEYVVIGNVVIGTWIAFFLIGWKFGQEHGFWKGRESERKERARLDQIMKDYPELFD